MAKEKGDRATGEKNMYYKGQFVRTQFFKRNNEIVINICLQDVNTGEIVARGPELRSEWTLNTMQPEVLVSGDNAYVMEMSYDHSNGALGIVAWRYALPSLELAPNSIPLVSIALAKNPSLYNASTATGEFIQSDDGTKIAYVNNRLGSTDDELLMLAETFSSDLVPLNELQVHKFHFATDRIRMEKAEVSDQGSVFALMKEMTDANDFTKKTANFTYRLYRFNGGEPTSQALVLPTSMTPSHVCLNLTERGPLGRVLC